MSDKGKVWLVGAGPGDRELLTRKAIDVINMADVIIYDALISMEILCLLPQEAELINAGKRSSHHYEAGGYQQASSGESIAR
jgi:siroheme synthase